MRSSMVHRITALWAFSESALGGMMHALHIPFTGFFVGGFAVLLVGLIAWFSDRDFKSLTVATLLVIAVKAAVSPHSPVMAYVAVAFQGLSGALLFSLLPSFRMAALIFAVLAMAESALQKFLIVLVFFGKHFFEALDQFINEVLGIFSVTGDHAYARTIVWTYVGIHILWGIVLGNWIGQLPAQIEIRKKKYGPLPIEKVEPDDRDPGRRSKARMLLFLFTLLVVLGIVYLKPGNKQSVAVLLYLLFRAIAVLFIWGFVLTPFMRWLIRRLQARVREKHSEQFLSLLHVLPALRALVRPAYTLAGENYKGLRKYKEFVLLLIIYSMGNDEK